MIKLLLTVRKALAGWKALPPADREQYRGEVETIRRLVLQLGGQKAGRFVEGQDEDLQADASEAVSPARGRQEIAAELTERCAHLLKKIAPPVAQTATDSLPRSVRIGGRITTAAARRVSRRQSD